MQIVTGYGGESHITSNDDQGRNQGMFGEESYVLSVGSKFAPTLITANELQIADGEAVMQGVHFRTAPGTYDSVTISNGEQGMNRKDLVVCRYTKDGGTGIETCEWVVIEGTPTSGAAVRPQATEGDILAGDLIADMPFFEVVLSGINVTAVNPLFAMLVPMEELQEEVNTVIGNLDTFKVVANDYDSSSSGKTRTYTLTTLGTYLIVVSRFNATAEVSGAYIASVHSNNSNLIPLYALPAGTGTVSINKLTLTVSLSVNYTRVLVIRLG